MPTPFRLQSVLDYRHNRVEALEIELSQLLNLREQQIAHLEDLKRTKNALLHDLYQAQEGELDMIRLTQVQATLRQLENRVRQQQRVLLKLESIVAKKKSEVTEAKQDEEVLQTLKDKNEARIRAEVNLRENRLQDDIYIAQAHRHTSQIEM